MSIVETQELLTRLVEFLDNYSDCSEDDGPNEAMTLMGLCETLLEEGVDLW